MASSKATTLLAKTPLLDGLDPRALSLLEAICSDTKVEAGRAIYRRGDEANCLYIIEQGTVRLRRDDENIELKENDSFGGLALLSDAPRAADAYATSDCELVTVERDGFRDMLFLHKDIAYEVLWAAVQQLVLDSPPDGPTW